LDTELDILQTPFKVRHSDSHDTLVRGDLDRPGIGHRRGEVDDKHSGRVLAEKSVKKAINCQVLTVTPARSAGISDGVAPKNPRLVPGGGNVDESDD
jgi:hypothetical protein